VRRPKTNVARSNRYQVTTIELRARNAAVAAPVGIRRRSSLSTAKLVLNAQTFGYRVRNARMDCAASWRDGWDANLGFDQIGRSLKRRLLRQREMAA